MELIYILDIIGTFAFAVSGALVASEKSFDMFGVLIIAFITAIGGGMIRDLLIDAHPINWIGDMNYLWTILIAVIVTFLFQTKIAPLGKTLFIFDTIGISVFTLLGLQKGLAFNLHPVIALIMGVVSACFGGVLRDVLTNKIPLIFQKEIYASACLAGGVIYLILTLYSQLTNDLILIISGAVIFMVRSIAVKFHLALPIIKGDLFIKKT